MSEWTTHLEFEEGTSSKFWRARVEGKTLYVNYGKIGSNGQTQVKDFADPAAAKAEYDKLVRDKRKKGYQDPAGGAASAKGADDDARDDADDADAADSDDADSDDSDAGDDGDDGDDDEPAPAARKAAAKPTAAAAKPAAAAAKPTAAAAKPAAAAAKPAAAAAKPATSVAKPAAPAPPSVPGHRLVLEAGNRKALATLYLDGKTVRMDSSETFGSPEAAAKAFERLNKLLGGEGYKPG
jgi:predicted DNA-binding WGR domain protein